MWDRVAALHQALRDAALPHAFGGALALAHYGKPRPTADVDLNVFVPAEDWPRVREALAPLRFARGSEPEGDQVRLSWDDTEVHVFLSCDPLHEAMATAIREVRLEDTTVPLVSPEHLVIRKAILDRDKDWNDIEAIVGATDRLDSQEIEAWLERLAGPGDPRLTRLRSILADG